MYRVLTAYTPPCPDMVLRNCFDSSQYVFSKKKLREVATMSGLGPTTYMVVGTLSIDDEMGRRRRPEVKFSRANLLGMRKVVKSSSSLRRRRNSGRFAVVAKT